jgi:hypothetical protein
MKIIQKKISPKHNDSFWYEGLIATTDDGKYELYARGEIDIDQNDEDGNHIGSYDGKARDGFKMPKNDEQLAKCYNGEDGYCVDMNNWFEINEVDEPNMEEVYDGYDEGIEALKELEKETKQYKNPKKNVIVNVNLEIKTPYHTKKGAEEFAMNYELPKEYVEDSFEIISVLDKDEE